jgi:hypothetical protein
MVILGPSYHPGSRAYQWRVWASPAVWSLSRFRYELQADADRALLDALSDNYGIGEAQVVQMLQELKSEGE